MTGASLGGREAARPAPHFFSGRLARALPAIWLLIGGLSGSGAAPARADFETALAAYDAGDYGAAYEEWLPLAKSGDGDAQAAIADLYFSGLVGNTATANGVRRNQATAAWWYRRAARCGHVIAQLNLGDFYARGIGVERDPVQASLWLGLAGKSGNDWANARNAAISTGMTADEKSRAADMIARWRPDPDCTD